MRLLLDTHVLLWWLADDPSLGEQAARAVEREPEVYVSAASVWEIAIKKAIGKLEAPDDLVEAVEASGFRPLPIGLAHADRAGSLPRHHDDPFDRMLVAQAQLEGLTLVTVDARLPSYEVVVLSASA